MKAWHFTSETLRDGRPLPDDGELLKHDGPLILCEQGLHASRQIIDALPWAPGCTICRVKVGGTIRWGEDKLVASERTILWRIDGGGVLRHFARLCALDVIHHWNAPGIVIKYLKTGDKSLWHQAYAEILPSYNNIWGTEDFGMSHAAFRAAEWAVAPDSSYPRAASVAAGFARIRPNRPIGMRNCEIRAQHNKRLTRMVLKSRAANKGE